MDDLIETMRATQRTPAVVAHLEARLAAPLRDRLPLRAQAFSHAATPCPCQFLLQQQFALPETLQHPIRILLDRAFSGADRGAVTRAQYLGITITHTCGDETDEPAIRWGFAFESGSNFAFQKGPNAVFEAIRTDLGLDLVRWTKVPNLPAFRIAFVGRRFTAAQVGHRFSSVEDLLDCAATDLQALHRRLAP